MPFPNLSELPHIPLSEEQESHLRLWIDQAIRDGESERDSFDRTLKEELDTYEAVGPAYKDFPWEDCSNLVIPVAASMVDTIYPRIYSTIFGVTPFFTVEDNNPTLAKHVKAYQNFLHLVQRHELKLQRVARDWFLEAVIHGTSVVKLTYEYIEKTNAKEYVEEDGEWVAGKVDSKVTKDGPALFHISLEDFGIPFRAKSIADAELCWHRIRTTWGHLKIQESMGTYKNLDQIEFHTEWDSTEVEKHKEQIEDRVPEWQEEYEIYEVWCDYDYDEDGIDESLVVTFHAPSQTILRAQFNPFWHGEKPFREFVYWPRPDRFYGVGICHMAKPHQDEITTIHNQNIDNRTVANTRMWEVVAGSRADTSFTGVAPSKKIRVDTLGAEIQALQLGEVYASSSESETMALKYAQQRTGVSDFLSGVDLGGGGGRVTATTTMAQMQEARTRFNWTLDSAREALSDIAHWTTILMQQFYDENNPLLEQLGEEDAELVSEFLSESPEDVINMYSISVTASSASMNKEIEKQNLIGLTQMLSQYVQSFEMPMVQIIMNPQTPPPLKEWAMAKLEGSQRLFNRVLQTFDVRDTTDVLGSLEPLQALVEPAQPTGAPEPGAIPTAGGANPLAGMVGAGGGAGGPLPGGGI